MHADELDFRLPPELIAQHAAEPRDSSRLLVCHRASGAVRHRLFANVLDELREDDLLVVNRTRVRPARVLARRSTGGAAEVLLLEPREDGLWLALARPYRRLREGETVSAGELRLTIRERLGEGRVLVLPEAPRPLDEMLDLVGRMPLPPYITEPLADPSRYHTVYADQPGSAAAPTAGLHFTPALWEEAGRRHQIAAVTLDVGLDTFRPLTTEIVEQHQIHSEHYSVPESSAQMIERALSEQRRVVAVGTTSVRVLETVFGQPRAPLEGRTRLLITPGYEFLVTGALITNFHLPRSTLLAMVMAFAGIERTRDLYRTAVSERYRFYSFGDACLFL
jgi:S-adenosylmethionine:tRNA ribosyltransferase-isomerase